MHKANRDYTLNMEDGPSTSGGPLALAIAAACAVGLAGGGLGALAAHAISVNHAKLLEKHVPAG